MHRPNITFTSQERERERGLWLCVILLSGQRQKKEEEADCDKKVEEKFFSRRQNMDFIDLLWTVLMSKELLVALFVSVSVFSYCDPTFLSIACSFFLCLPPLFFSMGGAES